MTLPGFRSVATILAGGRCAIESLGEESTKKAALLKRLSLIEDNDVLEEIERVLDDFGASQLQALDDAAVRAIVAELLGAA